MADAGGERLTPGVAEAAGRARAVAAARLRHVSELVEPPGERLSDERRALLRGLCETLLDTLEADLVALAGAEGRVELAEPDPARRDRAIARLLADPGLRAALFRRGGEHLLGARLRGPDAGAAGEGPVAALAAGGDPELAQAAMALIVAGARRQDEFGGPALALDELPAPAVEQAVWQAAALLAWRLGDAHLDREGIAQAAARRLLADRDAARGAPARALRLAGLLHGAGRATDALWGDALRHGDILLAAALLAVQADLAPGVCLDILTGDRPGDVALLLRLAQVSRDAAESALARLAEAAGMASGRTAARLYAEATETDLAAVAAAWRRDPAFDAALAALEP